MALNSILLALDGSAESRYAAEAAWFVAQKTGASVLAQHVINAHGLWKLLLHHQAGFVGSGLYFEAFESMIERLRTLGQNLLDSYESFVPGGIKAQTLVSEGSVPGEILKQLENADLLVVGHRHNGDIYDPEGGLAAVLVAHSEKPVLVMQKQAKPWVAGRLVVGDARFHTSFVQKLMAWMDALTLRKELYCLPNVDSDTATDVTHRMEESNRAKETVFVYSTFKQADHERYGSSKDDETLIIIPKLFEPESNGLALGEILQRYSGSSLLFWPVDSRSMPEREPQPAAEVNRSASCL